MDPVMGLSLESIAQDASPSLVSIFIFDLSAGLRYIPSLDGD